MRMFFAYLYIKELFPFLQFHVNHLDLSMLPW
jgi:hypothetical protein